MNNKEYYVYVYIDPRNFEEFYYGKGKGQRKYAHLNDDSDTEKVRRIAEIASVGQHPIIKVIAKDLTEDEAFLIEKTLIWKLGRNLTNISTGNFSEKFRPHNTMHTELHGFDFRNGIYYINVGEGSHRNWNDCCKYGFLSAGQGIRWGEAIQTLIEGDVVVAYLKNHGYVGVGIVLSAAKRIRDFYIGNQRLLDFPSICKGMGENSESEEKSEYVVNVQWVKSVDRENAIWKSKSGLFTSQLVKASLADQPTTQKYIEDKWGISFEGILKKQEGI